MEFNQETTTRKSSELLAGDIVRVHGMRVRIGEPKRHDSWASTRDTHPHIYSARGEVLNYDDLGDWMSGFLRSVNTPDRPVNDWTIQGNDLVTWTVECDTASNNSRQFYIETGNYMTHGEAVEWATV